MGTGYLCFGAWRLGLHKPPAFSAAGSALRAGGGCRSTSRLSVCHRLTGTGAWEKRCSGKAASSQVPSARLQNLLDPPAGQVPCTVSPWRTVALERLPRQSSCPSARVLCLRFPPHPRPPLLPSSPSPGATRGAALQAAGDPSRRGTSLLWSVLSQWCLRHAGVRRGEACGRGKEGEQKAYLFLMLYLL